jgi:hypothetical protein
MSKFEVPMRKNSFVGKPLLAHRTNGRFNEMSTPPST